ncbi:MAG: hypothetical protein PVJ33_07445 [Lysobacterales bacterium]|jgi:hypothetical protein
MNPVKKNRLAAGVAAVLSALVFQATAAVAAPAAEVTNGADSGPGSLRDALNSGAGVIVVDDSVTVIGIQSTLYYGGTDPLKIVGSGQVVEADGDYTLLEIGEGADLTVTDLAFQGIGGFSAYYQGTGKGIFVHVPTDREGTVALKLTNVSVLDVANHGIHVSDCNIGDDCGSGGGGGGDGSPASVHAILAGVVVDGVGYGKFDADGTRVDERGDGDILFEATDSSFTGVGADGVELDEGDAGDVIVYVRNSSFNDNGGYCLPVDADPNLEEEICYDDGELDLDDGFDVDEAGDGSVVGMVRNVRIIGNLDEGLDYDEEGEGGFDLELVGIDAWMNGDEGVKISEEDGGDLIARLRSLTLFENGDDGAQIEEEDEGDLHVTVNSTVSEDNDKKGLKVEQSDDGSGTLKVRGSAISGGISTDGVDEI